MRETSCVLMVMAVAFLFAVPARADRSHGMAESELIEDEDDVFTYPGRVVEYANLARFEYGPTRGAGTALGLFGGDGYAVGLSFQRGDLFGMPGLRGAVLGAGAGPAQNPGSVTPQAFDLDLGRSFPYRLSPNSAVGTPTTPGSIDQDGDGLPGALQLAGPHMLFDVLGGFELGGGHLGGRLSLGVGGSMRDGATTAPSSQGEIFMLFKGGYSGSFRETTVDTALSFAVDVGEQNDLDEGEPQRSASVTGVGFEGRLDQEVSDTTSVGGLLDLGYTSFAFRDESGETAIESNYSQVAIQGGVGPVFDVGGGKSEPAVDVRTAEAGSDSGDKASGTEGDDTPKPEGPPPGEESADSDHFEQSAEIAGYGVLGFRNFGGDPSSEAENDQFNYTASLLPGFHLAGEFHILEWLYFRSGAQYWFLHLRQEVEQADGVARAGGDTSGLGWTAGVGFEVGDFRFDGSLNRSFLRAGPQFLGGAGDGLFASASAQYAW